MFQVLVDQRRHAPRRRRHRPAADGAGARGPRRDPSTRRPARPRPTPKTSRQIRKAVIQAKWDLSERDETEIRVEPCRPAGGTRDHARRVRDADSRRSSSARSAPCRQALADAGLEPAQIDEVVLVGGSTRIPLVRRLVGELFGQTPHSELNPDEVVALGAAVQADILVTGNREMLLLDVTPLSLGIETMGGVVSKIILRNSTIPATGSEMFTTGVDNQTAVDIHVLQGERELVADNRSLARFKLRGIPPMPAGLPRVAGAVPDRRQRHPQRRPRASCAPSIEQTIEVKPSYGLTDEEVERMLLESFEHAEADFAARLLIEARNEAESVIHGDREVAALARISPRSRRPSSTPGEREADRGGARRPEARCMNGDRSRDDSASGRTR